MGGLQAFDPRGLPYGVVSLGTVAILLVVALTRGQVAMRVALAAVGLATVVWSSGLAAMLSAPAASSARTAGGVAMVGVALLGPTLLGAVLLAAGGLERWRWVLVVALVVALVLAGLCLGHAGPAHLTPWRVWVIEANPVADGVAGLFVACSVSAVVLGRRRIEGQVTGSVGEARRRVAVIVALLAGFGASDLLLFHGIGVYPLSFVPALIALGLAAHAIYGKNLLLGRGLDRPMVAEVVLALAVMIASWLVSGRAHGQLAAGLGLGATLLTAQGLLLARQRSARRRRALRAQPRRVDLRALLGRADRAEDLLDPIRGVVDDVGLAEVRLYTADGDELRDVSSSARLELDPRVRAWLTANRRVIFSHDLAAARLGGLREPVERVIRLLDAQLVVPLVDRERLVGLFTARSPGDGALADAALATLGEIQERLAAALAELELRREAESRAQVALEIEAAAAGDRLLPVGASVREIGGLTVSSDYRVARRFTGDYYDVFPFADGRVLLVIGDVAGRGVPAALMSATLAGACAASQRAFEGGVDLPVLLGLFNRAVLAIGEGVQAMTCFVALLSADRRSIEYASAGQPPPYRLRRDAGGPSLRAMIARGTALGLPGGAWEVVHDEVVQGDLLVLYNEAVLEWRRPGGERLGERRLQRILRATDLGQAENPAREALTRILGTDRPEDDLLMVVVRT